MIPILSWIILRGKCRNCQNPISWLYPFIELLTAIVLCFLFVRIPVMYIPAYFIFFSALIVTIRTDIETMLISRFVTLFLVPAGFIFSFFELLPITPLNSISGALLGYFFLYFFSTVFKKLTGKEGIGTGDFELLAFIGAFTGVIGCWTSLVLGSICGSLFGLIQIVSGKGKRFSKIPFGPFLALSAIIFVLFQEIFIHLFLRI